jgi:exopolyphosphatase/pppGpp-phosphohydrolase
MNNPARKFKVTLTRPQDNVYRRNRFYEILEEFLPRAFIDKALSEYNKNDAAHLEDHAIAVVTNADIIIDRYPELRHHRKVILTAALLHDVKCHVNRDKHHILGALAVYREYLCGFQETKGMFSQHQITMIEECVLEHRASWKHERSHCASECVAAADRGKPDLFGYMRRAVRFRYAHLPEGAEVTDDIKRQIISESIVHMREKFGDNGYAWETMPHYTLLMYEEDIAEMKASVTNPNSDLHYTAFDLFDGWVV